MRRIIDFDLMAEKAIMLIKQLEELKNEKNQLLIDINKINDSYKGEDATLIVETYYNKTKEIDSFIKIMEKYQLCFEWLSGSYKETHNKTKNAIEFLESFLPDDLENLNIESIDG